LSGLTFTNAFSWQTFFPAELNRPLIALLRITRYQSPFVLSFQSQPYYFPIFPLGIGFLLCTLPYSKFMGNVFDNRFFKFTALLSFGLYIWHKVVLEYKKIALDSRIFPWWNKKHLSVGWDIDNCCNCDIFYCRTFMEVHRKASPGLSACTGKEYKG
jgi:hypothetical protein